MKRTFTQLSIVLCVVLSAAGSIAGELAGTFEFCLRELRSPREIAEARSRAVVLDSLRVVFDLADIQSYEVAEHTIEVKSAAKERFRRWHGTYKGCVRGAFFIRVNGEVIYRGSTHSIFSSYVPPVPEPGPRVVIPLLLNRGDDKFKIGLNQPVDVDPRNDPRILQVLREAGVLRE